MTHNYLKHIEEDLEYEKRLYSNNFRSNIDIAPSDRLLATRFMEAELMCYNHLVTVFSSQFNRDYSFFENIKGKIPSMFGQMCYYQVKIYNQKIDKLETLKDYKNDIKDIPSMVQYILSEAVTPNKHIIPDTRRRMAQSILNFYVQQAEIKKSNSIMSDSSTGEIQYTAPYDSLATQTSFNKRHLQISRNSVKIETDGEKVFLTLPYLNKRIEILENKDHVLKSNWNYLILRQKDKVNHSNSPWVIDFKRVDNDFYFYKFTDRLGRSGIFEMGKKWSR